MRGTDIRSGPWTKIDSYAHNSGLPPLRYKTPGQPWEEDDRAITQGGSLHANALSREVDHYTADKYVEFKWPGKTYRFPRITTSMRTRSSKNQDGRQPDPRYTHRTVKKNVQFMDVICKRYANVTSRKKGNL